MGNHVLGMDLSTQLNEILTLQCLPKWPGHMPQSMWEEPLGLLAVACPQWYQLPAPALVSPRPGQAHHPLLAHHLLGGLSSILGCLDLTQDVVGSVRFQAPVSALIPAGSMTWTVIL